MYKQYGEREKNNASDARFHVFIRPFDFPRFFPLPFSSLVWEGKTRGGGNYLLVCDSSVVLFPGNERRTTRRVKKE
jgi:hypothetical protein